jgi:phosphatidylglycerophosphate synthase
MPAMAERRPIATRNRAWARSLAQAVGRRGVRADTVSRASLAFAGLAGAGLLLACGNHWRAGLVLAAVGVQLRLLANMIDGMVAVEHGDATATGPLWNELPDRLSDTAILLAAGYGGGAIVLGWACALAAMATAYVRVLGGALGTRQFFMGPQAKSQRMAVLTVAALIGAALPTQALAQRVLVLALGLVLVGSLVTVVRRVRRIAAELRAHGA